MDDRPNLHRWMQFRDAQRIGVRGIVPDPTGPTLQDHRRWINEHRYPDPVPAPPEIIARAKAAGIELRQEISGTFVHQGRSYWVPSASGPSGARAYGAGKVTRPW